jgi:hypothetical protein
MIDFSVVQDGFNRLALQLLIILAVPTISSVIIVKMLMKSKVHKGLINVLIPFMFLGFLYISFKILDM